MAQRVRHIVLLALALLPATALAAEGAALRIGVLKYGTVDWVLDVALRHDLDRAEGVRLERLELAGTPATLVALQAGRVDMVASDWLWVSRQRAEGADWTFFPFSTALGALVARPGTAIGKLADLRGRPLGVAGSPLDKSWLIMRLLGSRQGIDLDREASAFFAAPPLLESELAADRLDAVLTYWPSAARLEARGMQRVLSVEDALRMLGFRAGIPFVGYVVSERWARAHAEAVAGFARMVRKAEAILLESDEEWRRLAPRTGARDEAELDRLRDAFRKGVPAHWGDAERHEAGRLYAALAALGGKALVGPSPALAPGTFLDSIRY
jgi:NitT/TauT family transport system substrate-binding protein